MDRITIDGSYGEGGGQILRSALTFSACTGTPVQLHSIRVGRSRPGLRPQHLTAVRAAAAVCDAELHGDSLASLSLTFAPQSPPRPGEYAFDVSDAAEAASAGAVTLVLQTVLLPLALASGPSRLVLRGGTTVPMSPSTLFIEKIYLPVLFAMGLRAKLTHALWGFYPEGGGRIELELPGRAHLRGIDLTARGELVAVEGVAFASGLPSHIPQRMADRAHAVLQQAGLSAVVQPAHVRGVGVGAGIFLMALYEGSRGGCATLGRRGWPSEQVAEAACRELLAYHGSGAALDPQLGDQMVVPFALAHGPSQASVACVTQHLLTNVWVARHFGLRAMDVLGELGQRGVLFSPEDPVAPRADLGL